MLTAFWLIRGGFGPPAWHVQARTAQSWRGNLRQQQLPLLAVLLVLVAALQFCPLPGPVLKLLSPKTAELTGAALRDVLDGREISWSTVSVTPWRSIQKWLHLLSYVLFFMILRGSVSGQRSARALMWVLMADGTLLGLITFAKTILGAGASETAIGSLQTRYLGHYGMFMNRNTFAGHMGMLIPPTIAFAVSLTYSAERRQYGPPNLARQLTVPLIRVLPARVLLTGIALLISATVFCSGSRGAVVALVGTLFVSVLLLGWTTRSLRPILLVVGMGCALILLGAWLRGGQLYEKFTFTLSRGDARLWLWRDTAKIIRDFPLLGGGLGSFPTLFSMYKVEPTAWGFVTHPHNDYFNIAAELGIVGFALCTAIFLIVALRTLGLVVSSTSPRRYLNLGCLIGAVFLLIHGTLTVNLEVPANVFVLLSLLAIGQVRTQDRGDAAHQHDTAKPSNRSSKWALIAGTILPVAVLSLLVAYVWREHQARAVYRFDRDHAETEGVPLEERISLLSKALDIQPEFAKAHIRLGTLIEWAARRDRNYSYVQAHDHYVRAICAEALDPYAHYHLGNLYATQGRRALGQKVDRSESELLKAHTLAPMDDFFSFSLGKYYLQENRKEEAIGLFRDSLRLRALLLPDIFTTIWNKTSSVRLLEQVIPEKPELRLALSALLVEKGQHDAALRQLECVMGFRDSLEPRQRIEVARRLVSLRALGEAETWLRECIREARDAAAFERELVNVLKKEGKIAEAASVTAEIARQNPDDAGCLAAAGKLYYRLGELERAEDFYLEATKLSPRYYPRLAETQYRRHGNMSQIVPLYREWTGRCPGNPMAHRYLGLALERTGSFAEALVELEKGARLGAKGQFEDDIKRLRRRLSSNPREGK